MNTTKPNLLVIRSANIHQAVKFYQKLGLEFELHSHGSGPEHYAAEVDGFVFEIYPLRDSDDATTSVRFGFRVDDVDQVIGELMTLGIEIVTVATDSPWGRRAVVKDFDGHTVELIG